MRELSVVAAGPADQVIVRGLIDLKPVLEALDEGLLVVGGLMTYFWLSYEASDLPVRQTGDIDLGLDRRALHLTATSSRIAPLLRENDFEPYSASGRPTSRFYKDLGEGMTIIVDLMIAPGASRTQPPQIESGIPTIAAPGLAYAFERGRCDFSVTFHVDGTDHTVMLPLPQLDAAFVMKGALMQSGTRAKVSKARTDTVDAITLASACAANDEAVGAIGENRKRSDVKKALRWLESSFADERSLAARRVGEHFAETHGQDDRDHWAVEVARELLAKVGDRET